MSIRRYKTITVIDNALTGRVAKTIRTKAGVGLREVARLLDCSPSWICDLESGTRCWTGKKAVAYDKWLEKKHPMTFRGLP